VQLFFPILPGGSVSGLRIQLAIAPFTCLIPTGGIARMLSPAVALL
jgi:hypothetical protein